jgi:MATE family multidrug resistance protein
MVAQLGTIVTGFADTMMVGHYNTPSLAAGSLVTTVFNLVILLSLGFSYGITPLVGALASQGDNRKVGAMMRHVAAANVVFGLVLMLASGAFYFALGHLGQPVEIMPLVRPYYIIIWLSMIPVILTHIFRQSCDAVGDTQLGMWIFTAGNVLNIVGNYMLIFGKWGAPELGLAGAGWSTLAGTLLHGCGLCGGHAPGQPLQGLPRGHRAVAHQLARHCSRYTHLAARSIANGA